MTSPESRIVAPPRRRGDPGYLLLAALCLPLALVLLSAMRFDPAPVVIPAPPVEVTRLVPATATATPTPVPPTATAWVVIATATRTPAPLLPDCRDAGPGDACERWPEAVSPTAVAWCNETTQRAAVVVCRREPGETTAREAVG